MNQIETFFDTMAERWDAVCVHDPGKIRTILDRTNLRQNARILDVGCGTGILESYLLPYEPLQIVAIDIAGQMIEKARRNNRTSAHRVPPRGRYELRGERIRLYYPI